MQVAWGSKASIVEGATPQVWHSIVVAAAVDHLASSPRASMLLALCPSPEMQWLACYSSHAAESQDSS